MILIPKIIIGNSCGICNVFFMCNLSQLVRKVNNRMDIWVLSLLKLYLFQYVLGFYDPPIAKAIRRRDLGLKSHPKDSFISRNFT